jgi:hypothetical protein
MHQNQFTFTFETVNDKRVRVLINGNYEGYVRIQEVTSKGSRVLRLTYRASSAPFKRLIPTPDYLDLATATVADLIRRSDVYRFVVSGALSNLLFSYGRDEDVAMHDPAVDAAAKLSPKALHQAGLEALALQAAA